jgi:hypothetical protein
MEQERKQKLSLRIVQQIVSGCLALHLSMWKDFITTRRKQKTIVSRFLNRLKNSSLISVLNQWKDHTATRKRMRALCYRLFGSRQNKMLGRAFASWHRNLNTMTGTEAALRIKELEKSNAQLESELASLKAIQELTDSRLSDAQRRKKELGLSTAHSLIANWKNKSLHSTFAAWKTFASDSARGKAITRRFLTRWNNQQFFAAFSLWRDLAAEAVRHEQLVHKYASWYAPPPPPPRPATAANWRPTLALAGSSTRAW